MDQSVLFFTVPQTRQYGRYGGKYLLTLFFQEPEAIFFLKRRKDFEEKIAAVVTAGEKLKTSIFCPVCRRNEVSRFILPDLENFSPCFRQTCCSAPKCQKKLLNTYRARPENLLPVNLRTILLFEDEVHRRIINKFFQEILGLPKNIGGVEFIRCCQEIFYPVQELSPGNASLSLSSV